MASQDAWSTLRNYLREQQNKAVEDCMRGAMEPCAYKATCRRYSTLIEIEEKMNAIAGSPANQGEDVI